MTSNNLTFFKQWRILQKELYPDALTGCIPFAMLYVFMFLTAYSLIIYFELCDCKLNMLELITVSAVIFIIPLLILTNSSCAWICDRHHEFRLLNSSKNMSLDEFIDLIRSKEKKAQEKARQATIKELEEKYSLPEDR